MRGISRLGFGLSGIAGLVSRKEQDYLLGTAFDNGITHFDVAPAYGNGDAERILGKFVQRHRDRVTIATKAGLTSPFGQSALRGARQVARRVFRLLPALKRSVADATARIHSTVDYSPEGLRASIDCSLRELRIERIDLLLLHDWPAEAALREPILLELSSLSSAGKIKCAGIASSPKAVEEILCSADSIYQIVQFENSLLKPAVSAIINSAHKRYAITHSALSVTFLTLMRQFATRPDLCDLCRLQVGFDPTDSSQLSSFLMEWALARNPNGTVLFSTTNIDHVKENTMHSKSVVYSADVLAKFEALVFDMRAGKLP